MLTQVRLSCKASDDAYSAGRLRIVVKERYAPGWMRPTLDAEKRVPEGYLASLGLDEVVVGGLKVGFGVDY